MQNNLRKYIRIFFLITIFLCLQGQVSAFDDWSSVYENYDDAEYGKVISGKDYKNAVNAMKKYNKKDKKIEKKLKEKGLKINNKKNKPKIILEVPSRQEPLLTLSKDINYNGKLIHQGFYLVKPVSRDNNYFIRLTRGKGQIIADIEAKLFQTENMKKTSQGEEKVFSEILRDDMLKITYTNREYILEAYLWTR